MDEKNYVAYKLEVDDVGLKGKCSSEVVSSRVIEAIRKKIVQTSKNGGWIIFKKNGNQ